MACYLDSKQNFAAFLLGENLLEYRDHSLALEVGTIEGLDQFQDDADFEGGAAH